MDTPRQAPGRAFPDEAAAELVRRRLRNLVANVNSSQVAATEAGAGIPEASTGRDAHFASVDTRNAHTWLPSRSRSHARASELAHRLGGELVVSDEGLVVRIHGPATSVPLDRDRLARLPGGPPAGAPLLCLDTETTGLGSAAGTLVFLVGLGAWETDTFRQVQLVLPDHPDECAFLSTLAASIPPGAWLVTYNGRGFDWPLLVTRFRLARRAPPRHAGHLDLLSLVRRVFRHRLPDGRLGTVERELLGLRRHGDLAGWEIPGRYLAFVRSGDPAGLLDVVRHNDEDVRSLARLVAVADTRLCDPTSRGRLHPGDLLGLARAYRNEGRHGEALACLDALGPTPSAKAQLPEVFRPRPSSRTQLARVLEVAAVERARLLRRTGQRDEALAAWEAIAAERGRLAGVALIEIAKAREHERHDLVGALAATEQARVIADRSRALGRPLPLLEADIAHRRRRLARRLTLVRAA